MTIEHLENALRPNFVWLRDKGDKRLQTHPKFEGSTGTGVLVFIGLATLCGFSRNAIIDHLDITTDEFENKLDLYERYMQEAVERKNNGGLKQKENGSRLAPDFPFKVYTKSQLSLSYLKLHRDKSYFSLIDMGF